MSHNQLPSGRISTQYLLLMTSFFVGANTLLRAFYSAVEQGLTLPVIVKVGICLSIFSVCCFFINKKSYFSDELQRKHLMSLHLSFLQIVCAIGVLLFWVFLKLALFGSKWTTALSSHSITHNSKCITWYCDFPRYFFYFAEQTGTPPGPPHSDIIRE